MGADAGNGTRISRRGLCNQVGLELLVCQDLIKNVKFSNVLGVRQSCADPTREGRISERDAPERSSAPCWIYLFFFFCSNQCELREISGIFDCGSVEDS